MKEEGPWEPVAEPAKLEYFVTVPVGTSAGQRMQCKTEQGLFEIVVPHGKKAGDSIKITVPNDSAAKLFECVMLPRPPQLQQKNPFRRLSPTTQSGEQKRKRKRTSDAASVVGAASSAGVLVSEPVAPGTVGPGGSLGAEAAGAAAGQPPAKRPCMSDQG